MARNAGEPPYTVSNFIKFKENASPFVASSGQLSTVTEIKQNKDHFLPFSPLLWIGEMNMVKSRSINKAEEVRQNIKKGEQLQ